MTGRGYDAVVTLWQAISAISFCGTSTRGKAFWQYNGWKLRQDLHVLQKKTKEFLPARKTRGQTFIRG